MSKKITYDADIDTLMITFKTGEEAYYEEVIPGVNIEFSNNNEVIGIEIQEFKRFLDINTSSQGDENRYEQKINEGNRAPLIYNYKTSGYPTL